MATNPERKVIRMKKLSRKWIALIAVVILAVVGGLVVNNHRQAVAANNKGRR